MNNPFKANDKVFHVKYGSVIVRRIPNDREVIIHTDKDTYILQEQIQCISFTPWPEPNHIRNVEDGLYVVQRDDEPVVRRRTGGEWFRVGVNGLATNRRVPNYDNQIFKRIDD